MNFLIVTISPNSNLEEPGLPKGWLPVDNSIKIWLVEFARVSRTPVVPRGNNFAKRKGGPRNVVVLVILKVVALRPCRVLASLAAYEDP
jgi:hypothetical protein